MRWLPLPDVVDPHRALTDVERGIVYTLIDMATEKSPEERANAVLRTLDSAGYEIVRRV